MLKITRPICRGGAKSYTVERTADDLYQSNLFPNYNFVAFLLKADRLDANMYRITARDAATLDVQPKEHFEVLVKRQAR